MEKVNQNEIQESGGGTNEEEANIDEVEIVNDKEINVGDKIKLYDTSSSHYKIDS